MASASWRAQNQSGALSQTVLLACNAISSRYQSHHTLLSCYPLLPGVGSALVVIAALKCVPLLPRRAAMLAHLEAEDARVLGPHAATVNLGSLATGKGALGTLGANGDDMARSLTV